MDGSVASAVRLQLQIAPADATHFVISAGGNDALHQAGLLEEKAWSVAEALGRLAAVRETFAQDYRAMLDDVTSRGLPVAVCTIYDPRFPDATQRRIAAIGLSVFNDTITREAAARGLALIDLRLICTEDADLANPIEPSVIGGAKIANAIAAFAADYDVSKGRCEVFTGSGAKT
jgi:lysophospholipase L1-like esterase